MCSATFNHVGALRASQIRDKIYTKNTNVIIIVHKSSSHCLACRTRNAFRPPDRAPRGHRGLSLRLGAHNTIPSALRFVFVVRTFRHEWRPRANVRAFDQQDDRNNAERQTDEAEQAGGPLEAKVCVQRLRCKRQESAKSVSSKRRCGECRCGVLLVRVCQVVDYGHVNLIDS